MIVLDVGMGTSIFLRTRHHSLVYDFGPGRANSFSAADWGLKPWMQAVGIKRPNLLVASHVDQDHSGGLHSFDSGFRQIRFLSGTPLKLRQRFPDFDQIQSCHDYPEWQWDGVNFRFLKSRLPNSSNTNNRSCVLKIDGYHQVLLPGDIEFWQEKHLIREYGDQLASDILIVPHHGSATSSSLPFVNRVNPRYSVFTLAKNNRWGFPDAAVEARYLALGSQIYRTDINGAITFKSARNGIGAEVSAPPRKRIWRRW